MKAATHARRAAEAKRMAGEHALHASAHLQAGRLGEAANQFFAAGRYAAEAQQQATNATRAKQRERVER